MQRTQAKAEGAAIGFLKPRVGHQILGAGSGMQATRCHSRRKSELLHGLSQATVRSVHGG